MYLLDSDTVSLLLHQRDTPLARRVLATPPEHLWISTITVEQNLSGAWALVNHPLRANEGCHLLRKVMENLSKFQILPYDRAAKQIYDRMSAEIKRIGRADCQIASIALSRGWTVITKDVDDFSRIRPVVAYEDWTIESS